MYREKLIKSEVIQLFNTTKETLRHYEQKGLLTPEITDKNYRYYDFDDIRKLRQIFLFKDLELSVEEMGHLNNGSVTEEEYLELLKQNQITLKQKIKHLHNIEVNISQLVELLINGKKHHSYRISLEKERYYYIFDSLQGEGLKSPKAYFDRYQSIIQSSYYSERTLQMMYPFDNLESGELTNSQLSIELPDKSVNVSLEANSEYFITLPKGLYLSIFYPFKQDEFTTLPGLKAEIEAYLKTNGLCRGDSVVLEKEHPELSLFLDEGTSIYELQILVKYSDNIERMD